MKIDEYIRNNGVKITYLCEKIGVSRDTIDRVRKGGSVTKEVAEKIKAFTNVDLDIPIVDGHIRKRAKKA